MQRVPQRLSDRNVYVGVRGATGLRISPHLYTTDDDLARFFDALTDALAAALSPLRVVETRARRTA